MNNFIKMTIKNMSTLAQVKPPRQSGMTKLDKSKFVKNFKIWSVILPEIRYVNEFLGNRKHQRGGKNDLKKNDGIVLSIPQQQSLIEYNKEDLKPELFDIVSKKNPKLKGLLLRETIEVTDEDEKHMDDINYEPELLSTVVNPETYKRLKDLNAKYRIYNLKLDFDYWSYDDILKAILPEELIENCPSAFTLAGHLAHLNLKEQYMPYRFIIGEVILEKFVNIRTVVNKTNNITSEFRTFEMELLAGEDDTVVTQKETGCLFTFDFRKVYWNSRLATEHERLIDSFKTGEIVCDVMAGVGPFAVPAGKKPCIVFANDLNPESYKYMNINIKNNKVENFVKSSNLDGREFIKKSPEIIFNFKEKRSSISYPNKQNNKNEEPSKKKRLVQLDVPLFPSHYVMNLPDSAITFVDAYIGLYSNAFKNKTKEEIKALPGFKLPTINVHHFEKYKEEEIDTNNVEKELEKRMHAKIVEQLNFEIPIESLKFHIVRQVAPCKLMYCISFELPDEVAFAKN